MKTTNKEKTIFTFIILILFSLLLMGLDYLNWLNWLKRPIEKASNSIKISLKNTSNSTPGLSHDNPGVGELERENANLKVKLNDLEQENASMKKMLGAPLSPKWKFIPSKVLSVKNGIMTINQGSDIGIKKGQAVVFENILIGKIIKTNPLLSKIELVIHKDTSIKAKVIKTNANGIVKLESSGLILDEVLNEFDLTKNEIVVTSGEDEIYPKGLLIAKIDLIEKKETAIYQKALLKPLVDYEKLDIVFIVNP